MIAFLAIGDYYNQWLLGNQDFISKALGEVWECTGSGMVVGWAVVYVLKGCSLDADWVQTGS